jgi:hypothetical protein
MPGFFRSARLVAVLCGEVVCILGATVSAGAQNAPASAPVNRSEAVLSTSVGPSAIRTSHVETFAALLREIGADDLAAREEAITGQKQRRVDWANVNRTSIGLSDQEWQTAYAVLLDGSQRVADWGDAMQDSLGWKGGRFEAAATQRTSRKAQFDALSAGGDAIVQETMVRLRTDLGDVAFNRLDVWVYRREGAEGTVDRGPIRKGPIETATAKPPTVTGK